MDEMMMNPAFGAGFGIVKSELMDRPNEARDRALQASTAALSPWTGLKAAPVHEANWMQAAMGGAQASLAAKQQQAAAEQAAMNQAAQRNMLNAQAGYYSRGNGGDQGQGGQ